MGEREIEREREMASRRIVKKPKPERILEPLDGCMCIY